ncbi:beta-casein-like [Phyllostomus hastatus]|uniref:beta-casein-like n=1 Tax=Phyllostomus hastatus TaxID=9423 RepID=UPI001E680DD6|nr:beta-casein-like [Phyllostomus hastatus]
MRVLILACLVALALAMETVQRLSSSEILSLSLQDKHQEKIQSPIQPQALVYPFAEPIPYTVLPQNVLPLAQPAMVLPVLQPEVIQGSNSKATIFPNRHMMPFLKSPVVPFFQRQIQNLPQLSLPLLQPLMHQVPQPLIQTPMLPTQALLSLSQPKALPLSQQVIPYWQRDTLNQKPLLEPTQVFYPVTEPIATIYNLQQSYVLTFKERCKTCHQGVQLLVASQKEFGSFLGCCQQGVAIAKVQPMAKVTEYLPPNTLGPGAAPIDDAPCYSPVSLTC